MRGFEGRERKVERRVETWEEMEGVDQVDRAVWSELQCVGCEKADWMSIKRRAVCGVEIEWDIGTYNKGELDE